MGQVPSPTGPSAVHGASGWAEPCPPGLIVQNDMGERTMDFEAAVVIDEAQPSKLIHEIADVLPGRTHHLRQRFLTYIRKDALGLTFLSVTGKQQENTSQTFFAGVKKLVDQVRLVPDVPGKHVCDEKLGKLVSLMERGHHRSLFNPQK